MQALILRICVIIMALIGFIKAVVWSLRYPEQAAILFLLVVLVFFLMARLLYGKELK